MQPDQFLVAGLVLTVLAVPSILSAYREGRAPRLGAMFFIGGGGMVVHAANSKPSGYTLEELPRIFSQVLGVYI